VTSKADRLRECGAHPWPSSSDIDQPQRDSTPFGTFNSEESLDWRHRAETSVTLTDPPRLTRVWSRPLAPVNPRLRGAAVGYWITSFNSRRSRPVNRDAAPTSSADHRPVRQCPENDTGRRSLDSPRGTEEVDWPG